MKRFFKRYENNRWYWVGKSDEQQGSTYYFEAETEEELDWWWDKHGRELEEFERSHGISVKKSE